MRATARATGADMRACTSGHDATRRRGVTMHTEEADRAAAASALAALLAALVASSVTDMHSRDGRGAQQEEQEGDGKGLAPRSEAFAIAWGVIFPVSAAALVILSFDPALDSWRPLLLATIVWSCCAAWAVAFTSKAYVAAALLLLCAVAASSTGCALAPFNFDRMGVLMNTPLSLLSGWLLHAAAIGVGFVVEDAYNEAPGPLAKRWAVFLLCVVASLFAALAKSPFFVFPSVLPVLLRRKPVEPHENVGCVLVLCAGAVVALVRVV